MSINNYSCISCNTSDASFFYKSPYMPQRSSLIRIDMINEPLPYTSYQYVICNNCFLVQSIENNPPSILESENCYFSHVSRTIIERDKLLSKDIIKRKKVNQQTRIIELGGSDGTFLENFTALTQHIINIEPSNDSCELCQKKKIKSLNCFFSKKVAIEILNSFGKADIIVIKQVLETIIDLNDFLEGVSMLLKKDGLLLIEVPYVIDLIERNFYDFMAHIRKSHFSFTSLKKALLKKNLSVSEVYHYHDLEGGLRVYAGHSQSNNQCPLVGNLLKSEAKWGIDNYTNYSSALKKGILLHSELMNLIFNYKKSHSKIVGYGAGVKAGILLNYCGIDNRFLDFVVDKNSFKHGKFIPGVNLEVLPLNRLYDGVNVILLLAWIYKDEIINDLMPLIEEGIHIVVPAPEVTVIKK